MRQCGVPHHGLQQVGERRHLPWGRQGHLQHMLGRQCYCQFRHHQPGNVQVTSPYNTT